MRHSETGALPRPPGREEATDAVELLPGEFSALLRQIGSPEGFSECLDGKLPPDGIQTVPGLRDFLTGYHDHVLVPLELPAITRAHSYAARGHLRDLIALDQTLDSSPILPAFASASRRIGRAQLERLQPLRDERTIQRYLAAVEAGEAAGWHTVVYGLTLSVFSWPLRPGLFNYARETLSGLAKAASRPPGLPEPARHEVLKALFLRLPAAIEQTLIICLENVEQHDHAPVLAGLKGRTGTPLPAAP